MSWNRTATISHDRAPQGEVPQQSTIAPWNRGPTQSASVQASPGAVLDLGGHIVCSRRDAVSNLINGSHEFAACPIMGRLN